MIKKFENFHSDYNVDGIIDILFDITDIYFNKKLCDYNVNDYLHYMIKRKKSKVLFLWTFEDVSESELIKYLSNYWEKTNYMFGFMLHSISFLDNLTFIIFRHIDDDIYQKNISDLEVGAGKLSINFIKKSFADNENVRDLIERKLDPLFKSRVATKGVLPKGINYRNGDSANLQSFKV
jgi:hypothetical protein